ncbi:MAG: AAA family ATPase [Desulfovibrionaceae bacterium]
MPQPVASTRSMLVSGDIVRDTNFFQYSVLPISFHYPCGETTHETLFGGAWFLEDMIRRISPAPGVTGPRRLKTVLRHGKPHAVHHSYYIWTMHQADRAGEGDPPVWRISTFLGCQTAPHPCIPRLPEADLGVLVLDDLSLGFRDDPACWPDCLAGSGPRPESVVYKATRGFQDAPLFEAMQAMDGVSDFLTLVLSGHTLEGLGVVVQKSLSWERLVEDVMAGVAARSDVLSRCKRVLVHFGPSGAVSLTGGEKPELEFLVYHPELLPGAWQSRHPGLAFGSTSLMAAAAAAFERGGACPELDVLVRRGLHAMNVNWRCGGGADPGRCRPRQVLDRLSACFGDGTEESVAADATYRSVGPRRVFPEGAGRRASLLSGILASAGEDILHVGREVVVHGVAVALKDAPKAVHGSHLTVDREEVERINAVGQLFEQYQMNLRDAKPLSIAVFGQPGAGKSFAVKELARSCLDSQRILEFNLAQLERESDLAQAFQEARDASVQGQIPLVFWDEFDSSDLRWLRHFLAPMQDGEFYADGKRYPLGRSIFVFAGGTRQSFMAFAERGGEERSWFASRKGPDFVSRLRGYLNVKGSNPRRDENGRAETLSAEVIIRRAVLLRSQILQRFPDLQDPKDKSVAIQESVLRAFLLVSRYRHGARSLGALVKMSSLAGATYFDAGRLPPGDLLGLHVPAEEFLALLATG